MKDYDKQNEEVRKILVELLNTGQALLVVGAGCSLDLRYPSWPQLLDMLKSKFAPQLLLPEDPSLAAYEIKKAAKKSSGDLVVYERTIESIFSPKESNCQPFHCELVRLGFAGIATVNYDMVLEASVSAAFADRYPYCPALNMCCPEDRHRIEQYLRKLYKPPERPTDILHLHGTYNRPGHLVLSWDDYECHYNGASRDENLVVAPSKGPGFTFHRRVLWSLLTTRSLVFVGFGSDDKYFNGMMEVWHSDFDLHEEWAHIAIVGVSSDEEREKWDSFLCRNSVRPIFYHVPGDNRTNHRALHSMIHEIATLRGVQYQTQPSLDDLNARLLDMK